MQSRIGGVTVGRKGLMFAGGCLLLALLITVLLLILGDHSADSTGRDVGPELFPWASADLLVVPDELRRGVEPSWYPSRDVGDGWTDAEVADYWFDPTAIGIDVLDEEVESRVEELFSNVR